MKSPLKTFFVLFFLFIAFACFVICYPQLYYFNDKVQYKNFQVYYDKPIPNQIYAILDAVDEAIRKSECYDPKLNFKIFLRSDSGKYTTLPLQFPDQGSGWTIPLIKNVFLYQSDCATNTSYNHVGHTRALSSVLAHELTHVLVENTEFLKSKMALFDKDSLSPFGVLWKEEGYAEYIAGEPFIKLQDGLKILDREVAVGYVPHLEYFKYWLAVRHLILNKQMTFKEILNSTLRFDDVLMEAIRAEKDLPPIVRVRSAANFSTSDHNV